jgi:hypothetical protein
MSWSQTEPQYDFQSEMWLNEESAEVLVVEPMARQPDTEQKWHVVLLEPDYTANAEPKRTIGSNIASEETAREIAKTYRGNRQ